MKPGGDQWLRNSGRKKGDVLETGAVVLASRGEELMSNETVKQCYLGA